MSKSNAWQVKTLDNYFNTNRTGPATIQIALYTVSPTDGSAGTEVSTGVWTNYARVDTTRGTTDWPGATNTGGVGTISNADVLDFGTATTTGNLALAGAATIDSGNEIGYFTWIGEAIKSFTAEADDDTFTATAHGYSDGEQIVFDPEGTTLPTGITGGAIYFVRDAAANTFKVSATSGGSAINITVDGSGSMRRCIIVQNGSPVTIAIGGAVFTEE